MNRGDIYFVNMNPDLTDERMNVRPVLIIQNDKSNEYSRTTIVAAITSKNNIDERIARVSIEHENLRPDSSILLNQIKSIDTDRIISKIGELSEDQLAKVDEALRTSLGL